jgi:dethiobiotin synthetase
MRSLGVPNVGSSSSGGTSPSVRRRSLSSTPPRRYAPVYVAATRQHVGKTTTSLALMSGLLQRFPRVGFLKPVGQQSVQVTDEHTGATLMVDKDAALVKQYFQLDHLSYAHTSPVLIPPGYTRDYLDGVITSAEQRARMQEAFSYMERTCDIVLCEGTGHVAVGSIGRFYFLVMKFTLYYLYELYLILPLRVQYL